MTQYSSLPDSPLIRAYLADLDRSLANLPIPERAEIKAGIIEHIQQAIGANTSPEHITEVLQSLGSAFDLVGDTAELANTPKSSEVPPKNTRLDSSILMLLTVGLANAAWSAFMFPQVGLAISIAIAIASLWALNRQVKPKIYLQIQFILALGGVMATMLFLFS